MVNSFQNSTIAQIIDAIINQLSFEGESNSDISDILLSILNQTPYEKETDSVIAELCIKLKAKIEGESFEPFDKQYIGNISEIINSILNETEYDNAPNSRIAELLLELKDELENYVERTVNGAVASFNTSLVLPLVSLKADIDFQADGVEKVNIYQLGGNFFDKNSENMRVDALINGAGNEVSYADWNVSDFVPVVAGAKYYLYGLATHPNTQQDNFELFDENKIKVGFANVKIYDQPYTIPDGVKYIRFSVKNPDKNTAQFGVSQNVAYEPFNSVINTESIEISDYTVYGGFISITPSGATLTSTKNADGTDKDVPDVYELSGISDFTSFIGVNNIFSDSGDVSVTYKAKATDEISRNAKSIKMAKALEEQKKLETEEKHSEIRST